MFEAYKTPSIVFCNTHKHNFTIPESKCDMTKIVLSLIMSILR